MATFKSSNRNITPILLILLITLSIFNFVSADFDVDDIDDSYSLSKGDRNICPDRIELEDDDLEIDADDIELDDKECNDGPSIRLSRNPSTTTAQKFLQTKSNDIGSFLAGTVIDGDLKCGTGNISRNSEIILIEPEEDITIRWREMFGPGSALEKESSSVKLEEDDKYLIVSDKCFYKETNILDRVCFPADATVTTRDGSLTMDQLKLGIEVLVGKDVYSPVIAWTHQDSTIRYSFVQITTEKQNIMRLTKGHYIYADGRLFPAKALKIGMSLITADSESDVIVKLERVSGKGLYNPQTAHGDIVVDGIVATTYTAAVPPTTAHALLAPVRAAFCTVANLFSNTQSLTVA